MPGSLVMSRGSCVVYGWGPPPNPPPNKPLPQPPKPKPKRYALGLSLEPVTVLQPATVYHSVTPLTMVWEIPAEPNAVVLHPIA